MAQIPLVLMELREIQATEGPGAQIIVLGEVGGSRHFPIFIGFHEMDALDRALHGKHSTRPMTHDLIQNVIETMGGTLERVIVDDLRDEVFYGKLGVRTPAGQEVLVDSRPSDAIVVGVRKGVPIYVAEHVLEEVHKHQTEESEEE